MPLSRAFFASRRPRGTDQTESLPVGQAVGERGCHRVGDEVGHVASEGRHLLDPGRGKEAVMRRSDHVHALDAGVELAVELGHLELVLEVGDRPQPLTALKSVFCVRTRLLTTPTTTRSKTFEVLVMMSMWPLVTGS